MQATSSLLGATESATSLAGAQRTPEPSSSDLERGDDRLVRAPPAARSPPARPRRNYTAFPGRSKFWCDGRIMQGPDTTMIFATVTLILAPSAVFAAVDLPWLTYNVSVAVPIFFVLLVIFVFGSLFATSFRDPGVLPRGPPPPTLPLTAKPDAEADQLPDNYPLGHGPLPPLVIHEYTVNGRTVKTRYCDTCRIPRPPRVHHCRECDSCVDKFDHHCPWVANCVGRRNHRTFVSFVVSTTLAAFYIAAFALYHFAIVAAAYPSENVNEKIMHGLSEAPTSIFLAGFVLLLSCSVGGLSGMHLVFAATNDTTNESIKRMNATETTPYSAGVISNLGRFFCGPQAPSYIDRRGLLV